MPEDAPDPVTFKIRPTDLDWAGEEQLRLRRAESRKITQAELFERMRVAYSKGLGLPVEEVDSDVPKEHAELVEEFIALLAEPDPKAKIFPGTGSTVETYRHLMVETLQERIAARKKGKKRG